MLILFHSFNSYNAHLIAPSTTCRGHKSWGKSVLLSHWSTGGLASAKLVQCSGEPYLRNETKGERRWNTFPNSLGRNSSKTQICSCWAKGGGGEEGGSMVTPLPDPYLNPESLRAKDIQPSPPPITRYCILYRNTFFKNRLHPIFPLILAINPDHYTVLVHLVYFSLNGKPSTRVIYIIYLF